MLKNNKKITIGIFIGIFILIAITIAVIFISNDKNPSVSPTPSVPTETPSPEPTDEPDEDKLPTAEEELNIVEKYMNQFNEIVITRTVSTMVFDEEALPPFRYEFDEYIVSTIDLNKYTDETISYESFEKYNNPDGSEQNVSFKETFGFNYKDYENLYDIFRASLESFNMNILENSVIKKGGSFKDSQRDYKINDEKILEAFVNELSEKDKPDEILDKYAYFYVEAETESDAYITCVNMSIYYEKDGIRKKYIKSFEIYLPESYVAPCDCGCGSIDGSGCGDEECDICYDIDYN